MTDVAFIDSCVFINQVFGQTKWKKDRAQEELQKVEDGDLEGLTTPFVLIEVITAGRKVLVENTLMKLSDIEAGIFQAMRTISKIPNLTVYPNPLIGFDIREVLSLAESYAYKYPGRIKPCDKKEKPSGRKHKGMYACDDLHLAFAKHCGCDQLVTFDGDFEDTEEDVLIRVLRK